MTQKLTLQEKFLDWVLTTALNKLNDAQLLQQCNVRRLVALSHVKGKTKQEEANPIASLLFPTKDCCVIRKLSAPLSEFC